MVLGVACDHREDGFFFAVDGETGQQVAGCGPFGYDVVADRDTLLERQLDTHC